MTATRSGRVWDAFELGSLHAPEQQDIGQWFEGYLSRNGLPQFRHLVEQGALRYLTPILAHALIPRVLVPRFLESVIWPSVEDPVGNGATGDDIQQRMARRAPVMPRPLQRFVVHGGHAARDIIDRSILVAAAAATGEDFNPGLPDWLRKAIATSGPGSVTWRTGTCPCRAAKALEIASPAVRPRLQPRAAGVAVLR